MIQKKMGIAINCYLIAFIMGLKTVYQNYMYVISNQQLYMFTQFIYTCIKRHYKAGFLGVQNI